jgi:glycosyltransferase involved in cell wall biosynthesis
MKANVDITVIVCTYNRDGSLAKALQSLAASTLPNSAEWEVLVVDNHSTDRTAEVVAGVSKQHPGRFRYIFEPQQGLSHARNAGVREARGEVLAFTDDDVTVEPTWMHYLTASLHSREWAGAGGRTIPSEPFSPPRWLALQGPYDMGAALAALFDLGPEPCELMRPPYGANMAFRKVMFEKYGLFRTDLGASPNREVPGVNEDIEFGGRLLAAGERLRYEPLAVVYHPIFEQRVRQSYFLGWYYDYGRAMARGWDCGPAILGVPRRCFTFFKFLATSLPLSVLLWSVTLDPQRRFFRKCWVWAAIGQIKEIRRQWRSANRAR